MTDRRPLLRAIFDAAVAAGASRCRAVGALGPAPKAAVICLAAGKGAAAMAAAAERHYLDTLALDPARADRHCDHPSRPRRADAAGSGVVEAAPSCARRGRTEGRRRHAASRRGSNRRRSPAGAAVGWRVGELDRAGRRHFIHAETTGDTGAVALRRADRRDQHRAQAFVAHQRWPAGARRQPRRRNRDAGDLDVLHDDPSAIASGPTVPDPTTLADARALVAKYNLAIDDAVRRALDDSRNESCKPGDPAFSRAQFELIAKPKASLDAAIKVASDAGYAVIDLGADLEGEARDVAAAHAQLALKARREGRRLAILSGGANSR